ncbi:MAG: hypothetical protein ABIQ31_14045 [Ferruginibacter sp.]
MKSLVILFIAISGFVLPTHIKGQAIQSDSIFYQSAVYNALAFYQQSAGDQSRLFNGREYKPYRISFVKGHPFFISERFAEGSIIYEDVLYENVQILYDEVKELVIVETGVSIEMIPQRIGQFTIAGHTFVKLLKDSLNNTLTGGFYERLYKGKIEVYKKEKKTISEDLSDTEGVRGIVTTKKYYYIRKCERFYLVKNKNSMYEVLKDRKSEIQRFIKSQGLDFRNDTDNTLAQVAGYYDQLTR